MIVDMLVNIGYKKGNGSDYTDRALIAVMDRHNVSRSVAICQSEWPDNAATFRSVQAYPDRLIGIGMANPWHPDAEQELEKCFSAYGFRGVKFNCLRFGLSAERHGLMDPLFSIISRHGGFVIAHAMSDLFSIPNKWEEMARSFPDVPVLMSHIGSPNMHEAAIRCCKRTKNLYLITAGAFPRHIADAYEALGPEKLFFASDGLYGSMDQELRTIRFIVKDPAARSMILGGNAKDILNL